MEGSTAAGRSILWILLQPFMQQIIRCNNLPRTTVSITQKMHHVKCSTYRCSVESSSINTSFQSTECKAMVIENTISSAYFEGKHNCFEPEAHHCKLLPPLELLLVNFAFASHFLALRCVREDRQKLGLESHWNQHPYFAAINVCLFSRIMF